MLVKNFTMIRQLYMDGVSVSAEGNGWSNALLQLPSLQELSMSNCNISGPLHPSLTALQNLSIIRLDQNNLSSPVPGTFADFPKLTSLHLSACKLTGIFPEKIFQLATLSDIDISFNYDLNGSLPELPLNGSLQELIVSHTRFSGALPASIGYLKQLSILDISNCHFNGTLPSSMSGLKELTSLRLRFNNFTGLIPFLNMSRNLMHLEFSHNYFTGSITHAHVEGLRKLVHIDLQDNLLDGNIPASLFALPLVQSIYLSNNRFRGQIDEFSNISFSMLQILDLRSNNLEGPIPQSIFNLTSLNVLELSFNKLNGRIMVDVLLRLSNLTTLALSHNNLSVETNLIDVGLLSSFRDMSRLELASCYLTEFPSFLKNHSRITTLDLSSNHIQGPIPAWIWQLNSLVQLNLSHNFLSSLEGSVQNTGSNLSVLDLHANQLQGKLQIFPVHATYLDYSSNNFSFTVPSDVGTNVSSIIFLSLFKNNLSGSLPQFLCNSSQLKVLDVSYNHFNAMIPECLTQSDAIEVLNLQHNKFYGIIPDKFPSSCAVRTLDLNSNQLHGLIPKSIAHCTSLEVLDLGINHVDDAFPYFLNTISTLRVLILRGNKFQDHIECPDTNSTWPMLQIFDVALNNFSGLLPGKCFKTWKAMKLDEYHDASKFNRIGSEVLRFGGMYYQDSVILTIKGLQLEFVKVLNLVTSVDFSSNNFDGTIPEELMDFTGLYALNLSHNGLTGQIPSSMGNLKEVESLDLSCNNLDGEIPTELASLNYLSYLNLSYNFLKGKIPEGTQLQSFDASSFDGNVELCGPPLPKNCRNEIPGPSTTPNARSHGTGGNIIRAELGFVFGLGLFIVPLLFWKKWRVRYWKHVDSILCGIFPQLNLEYETRGGQSYQVLRWRP
ncbi:receptor like protein 22-like isoform X2 [Vigna unguiculata]|nr:receptor like protein 22-like isoform X2 [Vigna unguiculata]